MENKYTQANTGTRKAFTQ